ncbi:MAG: MmgE/PrpD family protein [Ktedonobacteraceae bacterium]
MERTLTQELARFVFGLAYNQLPLAVIDKAKACLLHGIAIGLAGMHLEYPQIARRLVASEEQISGRAGASVLGSDLRTTTMGAAFANGVLFHSRVQEDTHGTAHTGTVILPAALAIAEREHKSGREFIEAIVAGYEVMAAVSRDFTALSTPKGFRASSIYGVFGAAAATAKLLHLSEEQCIDAIGFASAFAFGTTQSFASGTMEWHFENGLAAKNGILATLLAQQGAKASPIALEGDAGFYHAFAGTQEHLEQVVNSLGRTWEILNVTFKLYPVCAFNQTPLIAALGLIQGHSIEPDDIERITVEMNEYEANYPGMAHMGPYASTGQTLMSTPFCIASALAHKQFSYAALTHFDDPETLTLVEKTRMVGRAERQPLSIRLEVSLKDGHSFTREMNVNEQYYSWGFEREREVIDALRDDIPLSTEAIQTMSMLIDHLEQSEDMNELVRVLVH